MASTSPATKRFLCFGIFIGQAAGRASQLSSLFHQASKRFFKRWLRQARPRNVFFVLEFSSDKLPAEHRSCPVFFTKLRKGFLKDGFDKPGHETFSLFWNFHRTSC